MDISVLGPLEVRRGDTAVNLGAPKLRVLLLSLALEVGHAVHADRLIHDLWGDEPPPQPLVSLRSYVSNLRRLLQEPGGTPVIANRAGGYALDVARERIDAFRFEDLARRGREAAAGGDPTQALELLTTALALWRGEALADIASEPHARPTVAKLEELRLHATEERFDALLALGRHVEAVPELEAFVSQHPSRERPHRQLVTALYRSGRAPDALKVAAQHRAVLVEEFGLDPSPELAQLTDRILRQDPTLDAPDLPAGSSHGDARPARQTTPVTARPDTSPLVGRDAERAQLAAALDALAEGSGGLTLFAGEPGIGKTALLEELSRLARARRVPVTWGRCLEHEGAPPFWPWLAVLRAAAEGLDDQELGHALSGNAALVTQLVPELADRVGREPATATGDPDAARFALYDAVATFLTRVAAARGLVVVLDDLHWADRSSLQLLALLASRLGSGHVLVAASYRDAATDRTPDLDAALAAVAREPATSTLRLRPLARAEVVAIVAEVTGEEPDARVVDVVYRRADGNPFFVRQLAALVTEEADDERPEIPLGVRHVLLQRMQQVPAETRRTLARASVFGQGFDVRMVAAAGDEDVLVVLDHVDVAIRHGLVEVSGENASAYRFAHALVRETIYDELTPGVAARLHAAAATALEQEDPVPVEAVAEHLWRAADIVPARRAVPHLRAAADEAITVLAHEQGERQLRRALDLLAREPAEDPSTELAVRLRLLQVLTTLHGWSAVQREEVSARVRKLAGRAGIGTELVPLWWSLWSTMMTRGDLRGSEEHAAELLTEAVRTGDPASLVAGHVATAYTDLFAGVDVTDVLDRLALAAKAEASADPDSLARTPEHLAVSLRVNLTLAHAFAGDADAASAAAEDAVAHAAAVAASFQQAYARVFATWAAALVDRPEDALRHGDAGLEACRRGRFDSVSYLITPVHAWAAARLGADPGEQIARMTGAIDALVGSGHVHAIGHWLMLLAEVHVLDGDRLAAAAALERAEALGRATGEQVYGEQLARTRRLVAGHRVG